VNLWQKPTTIACPTSKPSTRKFICGWLAGAARLKLAGVPPLQVGFAASSL